MKFDNGTWRKVKVSDLGRIVTGKTPKTSNPVYYGGDIPFLTPSDDMSAKYVVETKRTLTTEGRQSVKNMCLPADSVCVSCIGSDLGKVVVTTEETITNQQINSIIVDKANYDVDFVYYAMSILGKKINYISKTSTAVPIVNKTSFSSFTIDCPDLHEQKKISQILAVFDDKINNNNAINKNLIEHARLIYNAWLSENISKCRMQSISKFASINENTYSLKEKWSLVNYLDTGNLTAGRISEFQYIDTNKNKLPSRARRKVIDRDILYSTVRPNQRHYGMLFSPPDNTLVSTGFAVIRSNDDNIPNEAIYLFLTESSKIDYFQQLAEQSVSAYPSIKSSDIGDCLMPIPVNGVNLFEIAAKKERENRALISLRDTLLPRLITGEIDVSDIDI